MAMCVNCGGSLAGKKKGTKTCSDACRSAAYYKRKQALRQWKDCNLDMFDEEDVKRIGRISFDAAAIVLKLGTLYGRPIAREMIDAMADLLTNSGVNWTNA